MRFVILPRKLLAWDMIMWYLGEQVLITPMHVRLDFLLSVIKEKKRKKIGCGVGCQKSKFV